MMLAMISDFRFINFYFIFTAIFGGPLPLATIVYFVIVFLFLFAWKIVRITTMYQNYRNQRKKHTVKILMPRPTYTQL